MLLRELGVTYTWEDRASVSAAFKPCRYTATSPCGKTFTDTVYVLGARAAFLTLLAQWNSQEWTYTPLEN